MRPLRVTVWMQSRSVLTSEQGVTPLLRYCSGLRSLPPAGFPVRAPTTDAIYQLTSHTTVAMGAGKITRVYSIFHCTTL